MGDQSEAEEEVLLDLDELRVGLNLPDDTVAALQEANRKFDLLNERYGQLLVYMNLIDGRVMALLGEPEVKTVVQSHVGSDGIASIHKMRPDIPEDIRGPIKANKNERAKLLREMVNTS